MSYVLIDSEWVPLAPPGATGGLGDTGATGTTGATGATGATGPAGTAPTAVVITVQSADYTFVLADAGTEVEGTKATAQTFTIPLNATVAFPIGTIINVRWIGVGQPTIAITATGTLRAPRGTKIAVRYATATLIKRATDEWILAGDVTP